MTGNYTKTYNFESEDFTLATPIKLGYTFNGWQLVTVVNGEETFGNANNTVTIAQGSDGNLVYQATWTATPYTITVNLMGGTAANTEGWTPNESLLTKTGVSVEDGTITLPTVTRTDLNGDVYLFNGWKLDGAPYTGNTVNATKLPELADNGVLAFEAQWKLNMWTVTFVSVGRTDTVKVVKGSALETGVGVPPTDGEKHGYDFMGWAATSGQESGTAWETLKSTVVTNDTTYYAAYKVQTYAVTAVNAADAAVTFANGVATYGQNYVTTIGGAAANAANYDFVVTVTVGEHTYKSSDENSTIAISGLDVTVPASLFDDHTFSISVTALPKDFDVQVSNYNGTGISLILVKDNGSSAANVHFLYNGHEMRIVDQYQSAGGKTIYAYLAPSGSLTGTPEIINATAKALVTLHYDESAPTLSQTYDVNGSGALDYADTTYTYQAYLSVIGAINAYIDTYLRADVNGDGKVNIATTEGADGDVQAVYGQLPTGGTQG